MVPARYTTANAGKINETGWAPTPLRQTSKIKPWLAERDNTAGITITPHQTSTNRYTGCRKIPVRGDGPLPRDPQGRVHRVDAGLVQAAPGSNKTYVWMLGAQTWMLRPRLF